MKNDNKLLIAAIIVIAGILAMVGLTIRDGHRLLHEEKRQDVTYSQDSSVHESDDED